MDKTKVIYRNNFSFWENTNLLLAYLGADNDVTVPKFVDSAPIEVICEYVFAYCKGLTEITIPDGVISIGQGAFEHCKNLSKVTIPDSVTAIDFRAFSYCKRLEEIKLPAGLKVLADEMFEGCKRLKHVEIPEGVICIGEHAFSGCSSLISLTIPDSVTALGYSRCYDDNDELSYYDDSEKGVFDGCTNLRFVTYKGKTYDREHIAELYKAVNG